MVCLVQNFVSSQAERNPVKLMIQDGKNSITYGEMDSYTNRFARFLINIGVERRDKIAFYMEKSTDSFKALIRILKGDACIYRLTIKLQPIEFVLSCRIVTAKALSQMQRGFLR